MPRIIATYLTQRDGPFAPSRISRARVDEGWMQSDWWKEERWR